MLVRWLYISLVVILILIRGNALGQIKLESDKGIAKRYAGKIDTSFIRAHISLLSGAEMMGRETAEPGQKMAAAYLRDEMFRHNLTPAVNDTGYIQPYNLFKSMFKEGYTVFDDDTLNMLEHFYSFSSLSDTTITASELLFLGYGISDDSYDNYGDRDVFGKAAVIFGGEPMKGEISVISNTVIPTLWSDGYDAKLKLAKERGISILFVVQESFDKNLPRVTYYLKRPKLTLEKPLNDALPIVFISPEMLDRLLPAYGISGVRNALKSDETIYDIRRKGPISLCLKKDIEVVQSDNIVGIVKGRSKPKEYVVLSAHYDHLGMRDSLIYHGADDNGSGTSAVLELMRVFSLAEKEGHGPERSVVFLFFSGEEKGLLGSSFFTNNPEIPLSNMVANLNVDMIGRTDGTATNLKDNYIYLIGSDKLSMELHEVSEQVNKQYGGMDIDYRYNDPNDPQRLYYRSDHYNFAKHGIPVIFYFRGLHEDYHKPTDTVDKIEFDTIDMVTKLIFHTAWELANRRERILVDQALD